MKTVSLRDTAVCRIRFGHERDDRGRDQAGPLVGEAAGDAVHEQDRGHSGDEVDDHDDGGQPLGNEGVHRDPLDRAEQERVAGRVVRRRRVADARSVERWRIAVAVPMGHCVAQEPVQQRVVQSLGLARRVDRPGEAQDETDGDDEEQRPAGAR